MENETTSTTTTTTETTTPQPAQAPAQHQEQNVNLGLRTFTQDQLDAIIARERSKATKGMFSADAMAAKDSSITALTTERDAVKAENARLKAEIDGYKNQKFLSEKGVPADMLEFYAFKIGKLVTDNKPFEKAAEEYLKENPPAGSVRVSTGGNIGGANNNGAPMKSNDIMNNLFRGK